ncbi:hypothetical protein ABPG73_006404 [Tetrahymena malaccensis]
MEKQNILSQGQDSIEPTKNLLNENQLSNQVSYPKQFQNKEDFSQNSNGFMDTNISVISEQTLQKRVRSQINRRRNVQQTRIFQNAMCQIINQSENQHAIISYEDQDNNNFIQHISSKKSSNQIVQQQNQKTFCIGNNSSQNSFVSQEGQVQQKQINKEIIPNNQIKCQQLIKLQENSLIKEQKNVQQHEKEQSLQYEKITDQVNIYQQESIHGENNCSQNNSNKKEGYINEQENIQEMSSNYQVNYLQLKNEKAYTIQQNDQQQDNNKVSLSQEYTNVQENILQLENIDRKEYMYDKNFSNNDLSKIEVYIEQKQTTKQNISNIQINSPQIIELQFEEKTNENSLKDLQKHNKENSLNQEQASNQKSAHEQKNIGENVNLIKDHVKQIYGENKTKPSSYQIQKSNLKTQNISDKDAQIQQDRNNSTQQDAPTIQNEFQSIEYKKRSKTIEQNNLTKSFSSQLDTMFKVIMDYKFSEFEKLEELQQIGCEVKKQWSQQTFEKVEELTKNQLNENQLSNQVSYLEQSQNQEGFSNILKGFKDTSISVISEQTLQKRVRSQIVRRRNVNQTRIFQNAMCQIINQSEDQHAIISYQDQDNNNSIQHISSRRSNNQIVQQYDQKSFCLGSNGSQNSFGSQEGQAKQKQITKEDITDNQIKCQQLLKLKEDSFTNKQQGEQQHEKEQSLKHEKISCQVNIDQQQNIQGGQISSQNDSNKKEDYIKEQENIQDSNNQVNNLQLKNEKAYTIQQNDQQKDSNKLSLNQEYTNAQENAQQLENKKSLMCDKNYQNNDLSKIEAQIEQKQTTQQTISNNQINSTQTIEFQFEEKCNENLLKDAQKHNKENSLNQEQAVNQKNANEQLKSNLKQQNISDQDIQISNDRNNPIQQNTPTIQREIQSIENEEQSKTNKNIQELNNLIKRYSSQLEKMFKEIMDYNFSEFEESGELDQIGCLVKKKWNQQTFEKVEGNQVQSEIFQSQKSKIFESLQQQQYYLCKILISNQMQDFILGFFQDNNHIDDEYIFQITYNSVQSDIDSQKLILQILGFEYDYVKLEQENISVLIIKKDDFLSIQDKFEQLVQFESNIQQIQNFYEINSSDCQEFQSQKIYDSPPSSIKMPNSQYLLNNN